MRRCNECLEEKPLEAFSKGGKTNKGLCPYCKSCGRKLQKHYQDLYKKERELNKQKELALTGQTFLPIAV